MISSFEKRIPPGYLFGIPKPAVFPLGGALLLLLGVVVAEEAQAKTVLGLAFCYVLYAVYEIYKHYGAWLVRGSMKKGKHLSTLATFGAKNKEIYADSFGWKTAVAISSNDNAEADCLLHHDNAVSIAFSWSGVHNRFYNEADFHREHQRRVTLLKRFANKHGLCVENHLLRQPDSRLVDAYEAEGRRMFQGKQPPQVIAEIREGMSKLGRYYGRSNRVVTVLSLGKPLKQGLLSWFTPQQAKRHKSQAELGAELLKLFKQIQRDFADSELLSKEEYQRFIQAVNMPFSTPKAVDWRFALNEQLVTRKPEWDEEEECLVKEGVFYKVCLLQGYPKLSFDWVFQLCEAGIDLHISQIIQAKDTQKALDANKRELDTEQGAANEKKSLDFLSARLKDMAGFRQYVANNDLSVFDNAYIVTFYCRKKGQLAGAFDAFEKRVNQDGFLRVEKDLQLEMFRVRLPGLGRNSLFLREDHSDTVAAMMPFTTYPIGNTQPEMLRIAATGNLVGFSPSKVEVPHEMVVAETNGGKDTQFGIKIAETYPLIRYDIVELGNSYQGLVEAIGGRYCRAREQVINPLMGYADYEASIRIGGTLEKDAINTTVEAQILGAQSTVLTPIFKGMKGGSFSSPEEVALGYAMRELYAKPISGVEAPTLPQLLETFNCLKIENTTVDRARHELAEELYLFMEKPSGEAFKEQGQFVISPIANAIDFDKFDDVLADYFLSFMCIRLANNAFARGARSQIVLNEYKMLLEKSPEAIRWISLAIDRMGRKDWVGLTRISQGYREIESVDSEANSSIVNRTVLSRSDQHDVIGQSLAMPGSSIAYWKQFRAPKNFPGMNYREALVCENETWHQLYLRFPEVGLKLMNTSPDNKALREIAYQQSPDAYERIRILDELMAQKKQKTQQDKEKYSAATALI